MSESPLALTIGQRNSAFLSTPQDFHKQRVKITRRIHNLKRYLKIQSKNTKDYKPRELTIDDYQTDNKYYLLSLLLVERDYLYALELKAFLDLNSNNNVNSIKSKTKLILTRLKKSKQNGNLLVKISKDESDLTKRLEILVYNELISGFYSILNKNWSQAIQNYSNSRIGLKFLELNGEQENKILYKDIIEELIDDSLKLAIYRFQNLNSIDLNEFTKKIINEKTNDSLIYKLIHKQDPSFLEPTNDDDLIKSINWRNYTAQINDDLTSKLISSIQKIKLINLESFDTVLNQWQSALENHLSYISKNPDSEDQDDEILLSYINYNLLIVRLHRDHTLINNNQAQTLRILDGNLSTIDEIKNLPGVYSDDELMENLEILGNYYKVLKINLISNKFTQEKKYKEGLLLLTKALSSLQDSQFTIDFKFLGNDELSKLINDLKTQHQKIHILSIIQSSSNSSQAVSDDLFKFNNQSVFNFNPVSIPVKPVLFDVAFNYISYNPDQDEPKTQQQPQTTTTNDQTEQKKKGFFGLFGRG
ncbi:Signal recognition particle protein [Wickerhamomyces ciferrii]|uniref:Signal recognition particle subunit SRP68 n=1 Tax=Wickerhamomyces ciferrii (strain ATCC 14091 / BCRC 22168 / CBS 111 / JCM 3599 / NBRC 0793 / NRRL Y-1031 F-60-10) TaxID=1206466 RepID=K0KL44_WICCF|nr:Signal recognition particle protein [Wickerhamomyces ciferrii]CCH42897.1 Signal recognition particle protein [Wickerhamomyces ciferrii]